MIVFYRSWESLCTNSTVITHSLTMFMILPSNKPGLMSLASMLNVLWLIGAIMSSANATTLYPDVHLNANSSAEPIRPIAPAKQTDTHKLKLGYKLFHEKRLDKNQKLACANCHNLKKGGTNRRARSGSGNKTKFNTPSIYNVSLNTQYYWSGKFSTLEAQLDDALSDINTSWPYVINKLQSLPEYTKAFDAIYIDGITVNNIKDVITYFEKSLLTPNSPFDQYLQGNANAISVIEKRGYRRFKTYGCITCHQGVNVGGNFMLNRTQPIKNKLNHTAENNNDLTYIRVPSLRNVAITAPYFHDGSVHTLYKAVERMLTQYVGAEISHNDIQLLVKFLHTLTGEYKGRRL